MTSLTPHICVGDQVAEPMVRHLSLSWREARARALTLLQQVHVPGRPSADDAVSARTIGRHAPAGHDRDCAWRATRSC